MPYMSLCVVMTDWGNLRDQIFPRTGFAPSVDTQCGSLHSVVLKLILTRVVFTVVLAGSSLRPLAWSFQTHQRTHRTRQSRLGAAASPRTPPPDPAAP